MAETVCCSRRALTAICVAAYAQQRETESARARERERQTDRERAPPPGKDHSDSRGRLDGHRTVSSLSRLTTGVQRRAACTLHRLATCRGADLLRAHDLGLSSLQIRPHRRAPEFEEQDQEEGMRDERRLTTARRDLRGPTRHSRGAVDQLCHGLRLEAVGRRESSVVPHRELASTERVP